MSANRSTAVMQRRQPAPDALDYFPTPPWAARALCEFLRDRGEPLGASTCWEPACGELHMVRGLADYFSWVNPTDVHRYSLDHGICDFLIGTGTGAGADWIITNPPFLLAQRFIETALKRARRGVAMLVRSAFIEGAERHRDLFSVLPPSYVLQFAERVVMLQGRLIQSGAPDPFNLDDAGAPKKASNATSYCWLVWMRDQTVADWSRDTRLRWIGKSRARLEREGDYPAYAEQWAAIARTTEGALL